MQPPDGQRAGSAKAAPFDDPMRRLGLHDQAALVFADDGERAAAAGAFLRLGLQRGEACLHLVGVAQASAVLPHLRAGGADVGSALATGRLALVTDATVALRSGHATPGEVSAYFRAALETARAAGASALRLSVEPSWSHGDVASLDRLLACEAAVHEAVRELPVVVLFQYDRRRLLPGQLVNALRMHPYLVSEGELCRNGLHLPPSPPGTPPERGPVEQLLTVVGARHREEQAAVRGQKRLRRALDGGAHALWDWNVASGRIVLDRRRLELCPGERARSSICLAEVEQLVHPDDLGPLWRAVKDHLAGRTPRLEHEHRLRGPGGLFRWVCLRGEVTARDEAGAAARVAGTATEVTGLRELRARQTARERMGSLAALSSAVAHEVNNPIAWIAANLGYLRERLAEPAVKGALGEGAAELGGVLGECQEGVTRVRDALSTLRSVAGPGEGPPTPFDLREELPVAASLAREEVGSWARFDLDVPQDLPPVPAHRALRGVLVNLLLAAAHALPEDRRRTQSLRVRARRAGETVRLEIFEPPNEGRGKFGHEAYDPFASRHTGGSAARLAAPFARPVIESVGGIVELEYPGGGQRVVRVVFPMFINAPPLGNGQSER